MADFFDRAVKIAQGVKKETGPKIKDFRCALCCGLCWMMVAAGRLLSLKRFVYTTPSPPYTHPNTTTTPKPTTTATHTEHHKHTTCTPTHGRHTHIPNTKHLITPKTHIQHPTPKKHTQRGAGGRAGEVSRAGAAPAGRGRLCQDLPHRRVLRREEGGGGVWGLWGGK